MNPGVAKAALAAVVLSAAGLAGLLLPVPPRLDLVTLAALAGAAALVALRYVGVASVGLPLLLVCAVLAPMPLGGGAASVCVVLAVVLTAVGLVRLVWRRRSDALEASPLVVATLAFMSVAVLAFLVGQYPWLPSEPAPMRAQLGGLALFLLSGGLLVAVALEVGSVARLERLTWLFLAAGSLVVASAFGPPVPGLSAFNGVVVPESIGSLFWTWLVAMSVSQALCNPRLPPVWRALLFGLGALALARGLWLAFSWVSGWLPPLVSVAVIVCVRFPRTALGGGLLAAAPALLVFGRVSETLMAGESYSLVTRLEAATIVVRLLEHNPWLGFGPANYYHYTVLYPILGWWVRFNSHNNYVDLVAQTGVIGLVVFAWLVVAAYRVNLALKRRAPAGFPRAYAVGVIAGLSGSLVAGLFADWIVPFAYNVGLSGFRSSLLFWFFLGGSLALRRAVRREAARAEDNEADDPLAGFPVFNGVRA